MENYNSLTEAQKLIIDNQIEEFIDENENTVLNWAPEKYGRYYTIIRETVVMATASATLSEFNTEPVILAFKTRNQAQEYLEVKKARLSIIRRIETLNAGWNPVWNGVQPKYYVGFDMEISEFYVEEILLKKGYPINWYLETEEKARQLIVDCENDLRKILIFS